MKLSETIVFALAIAAISILVFALSSSEAALMVLRLLFELSMCPMFNTIV
jgi:hypothetical protein